MEKFFYRKADRKWFRNAISVEPTRILGQVQPARFQQGGLICAYHTKCTNACAQMKRMSPLQVSEIKHCYSKLPLSDGLCGPEHSVLIATCDECGRTFGRRLVFPYYQPEDLDRRQKEIDEGNGMSTIRCRKKELSKALSGYS